MPRRPNCRRIGRLPQGTFFKPAGIPGRVLEEVRLMLDEAEALRLADLEELYHDAAGERMGVSRATFGRILDTARRKIAEAIFEGKALRIEGGPIAMVEGRWFECMQCGHEWAVGFGTGRPAECPQCGSEALHRAGAGAGPSGGGGRGRARCRGRGGRGGRGGGPGRERGQLNPGGGGPTLRRSSPLAPPEPESGLPDAPAREENLDS